MTLPAEQVNHPTHYQPIDGGTVECIDAIQSALGQYQYIGFLRGQIMKYAWRLGKKDLSSQDAKKLAWYAGKLTEALGTKTENAGDECHG